MQNKKRGIGKKGLSVYVSWVLVMAFVVGLSVFMFSFMHGYAARSSEQIKERSLIAQVCDTVAVTVDSACQNTQNLYINITNRGDISIDKVIFRTYDLYYEPQIDTKEVDLDIGKYNAKEVQLIKRGDVKKIRKIEIVPIVLSEGEEITCESRMSYYPLEEDFIGDCLDRP